MKKQLMIAILWVMSSMAYNITHAAAAEEEEYVTVSHEIPRLDWVMPGWIEVQWENCKDTDNVKHFPVNTTVGDVRMVFSILKKIPLNQISISIGGIPIENDQFNLRKETDLIVATPGIIIAAERICRFVGNMIEVITSKHQAIKEEQNKREKTYLEDRKKKISNFLLKAAQSGNFDKITQALKAGADINVTDETGRTPLMNLIDSGIDESNENDMKELSALIKSVATVNAADKNNDTALTLAARKGLVKVVQVLIGRGAAVNKTNNDGSTALIFAARKGDRAMVDELIKDRAIIDMADKFGNTALIYAALGGWVTVMQTLIDHKADVNVVNKDGDTVLILVVKKMLAFKKILTEQDRVDAAQMLINHTAAVQMLIAHNANVNIPGKDGDTALMLAVIYNNENLVDILAQAKANIDGVNKEGYSPLMWSAYNNKKAMADKLIHYGADVNGAFKKILAISKGRQQDREAVQFLWQYNINVSGLSDAEKRTLGYLVPNAISRW